MRDILYLVRASFELNLRKSLETTEFQVNRKEERPRAVARRKGTRDDEEKIHGDDVRQSCGGLAGWDEDDGERAISDGKSETHQIDDIALRIHVRT